MGTAKRRVFPSTHWSTALLSANWLIRSIFLSNLPKTALPQTSVRSSMQTTTIIFFTVLASSASAATLGYHAVSLCPANGTSTATTWAGRALGPQEVCPTPFSPASQSLFVNDFRYAQQNKPAYVPRSNTYALSVFRSSSVASVFLDFAITDATGKSLVPRTKVALQPNTPTLEALRREGPAPEQPTQLEAPKKGKRSGHSKVATPFRGRRKGKGGIMGGIGGGGRYGGGTGGFKSSGGGAGGKSYGYSSGALGSRYAPGYTRTTYGYHGRSAVYLGAPMFLYSAGRYHRGYHQDCERYSGTDRTSCQQKYSRCTTANSTGCIITASSELVRDDIMAAAIDIKAAVFPLNITIFNATITFMRGARPEPWDAPLLLSFSEVDFDDENDPDMEFWVFCLLMSIALVVLCAVVCFCWCAICDGECCCRCERRSEEVSASRTTSKELEEWDVETGRGEPCSMSTAAPTVALGKPVVGDIDPIKDPEFVTPRASYCDPSYNMEVVAGYNTPVIEVAPAVPDKHEEASRQQA